MARWSNATKRSFPVIVFTLETTLAHERQAFTVCLAPLVVITFNMHGHVWRAALHSTLWHVHKIMNCFNGCVQLCKPSHSYTCNEQKLMRCAWWWEMFGSTRDRDIEIFQQFRLTWLSTLLTDEPLEQTRKQPKKSFQHNRRNADKRYQPTTDQSCFRRTSILLIANHLGKFSYAAVLQWEMMRAKSLGLSMYPSRMNTEHQRLPLIDIVQEP